MCTTAIGGIVHIGCCSEISSKKCDSVCLCIIVFSLLIIVEYVFPIVDGL